MNSLAKKPVVSSGAVRSSARNAPNVLLPPMVEPYSSAVAGDAVHPRRMIAASAPLTRLTVLFGSNESNVRAAAEVPAEWTDTVFLSNIGSTHALSAAEAYEARNALKTLIFVSRDVEIEARRANYSRRKLSLFVRAASILDLVMLNSAEHSILREADIATVIGEGDGLVFHLVALDNRCVLLSPGHDSSVLPIRKKVAYTPRRAALLDGCSSRQVHKTLLEWLEVSYEPLSAVGIDILVVGNVGPHMHGIVKEQGPQVRLDRFVEDMDPILADCRIGIVPDTVGGSFELRLLTHVFRRVPIVGLNRAVSGIPVPAVECYLDAQDLKSLADLVVGSLDDFAMLNALQERCFAECAGALGRGARGELFAGLLRPAAEEARHENLEVGNARCNLGWRSRYSSSGRNLCTAQANGRGRRLSDPLAHHADLLGARHQRICDLPWI